MIKEGKCIENNSSDDSIDVEIKKRAKILFKIYIYNINYNNYNCSWTYII